MLSTATLVICDCDTKVRERIENSAHEKLSVPEQSAVKFCMYSDNIRVLMAEVNELIDISGNLGIATNNLNVILLFDQGIEMASHIRKTVELMDRISEMEALAVTKTDLLLLLKDNPLEQEGYCWIANDIPYTNAEHNYHSIYVLTDRNSIRQKCRDDSLDAAALLVYLAAAEKLPGKGVYSAGIGKLSASTHENKDYCIYSLVAMLKDGRIDHKKLPDIKTLCDDCMGDGSGTAKEKITIRLNNCISNTFCFIEGESEKACVEIGVDVEDFSNTLVQTWKEKMIAQIRSNPFCAEASTFFDRGSGAFEDYVRNLQVKLSDECKVDNIPKKLVGNRIINQYNEYISICNRGKQDIITAICSKLRDCGNDISDVAEECKAKLDRICKKYNPGQTVLDMYRKNNQQMTANIDEYLMKHATFEPEDCREDLFESDTAWQELIDKLLDRSGVKHVADDVVAAAVTLNDAEIVTQTLSGNDAKAMKFLASLRFGNIGMAERKIHFMPHQFSRRTESIQTCVNRNMQISEEVISVTGETYDNIEEIAIFQIGDGNYNFAEKVKEDFIVFADCGEKKPAHQGNEEPMRTPPEVSMNVEQPRVVQPTAPVETADNRWQLNVSKDEGRYKLFFNWAETSYQQVQCQVSRRGTYGPHNFTVNRDEFLNNLYVDITSAVNKGRHVVELMVGNRVLASCEFDGKQQVYSFSATDEAVSLSRDKQISKYELSLYEVDGSTEFDPSNPLFRNLELVLNQKVHVRMPAPVSRGRKVRWTIYTDCEKFDIEPIGEYVDGIKTKLI